ncbi:thioredoxin domain-containing protein [Pedobacter changchengzhani]|uniref:Thioredoxin domain-containing protein n=1 Tax=Pedobacter changchengzhani TaxID=2529274 RepID=A0A4R5MHE7_9SPHI|nr:thioredoxin domain-containing protein [Pedobacter changchengzhani]TDG34967.1 thioredoxin domain-containing protein [Pedobacter changchengzhani]
MSSKSSEPNNLIKASSPYLLQHAYNPVKWFEWGEEALQKAKVENKLILVSIGYSACHWCHVMERESFENFEVAEVMNQHFVCIKVDREERPDIDQIYMYAIQLMTGSGGWPLNCICLPDQRPVYGGTYFRKEDWINVLENVASLWANEPEKALQYAERLMGGINDSEKIIHSEIKEEYTKEHLIEIIEPWKRHFDITFGGYNRAPKFPLPNNWTFLLRYAYSSKDESVFTATCNTLEQMSWGGIYDQIGGGFARYSVDDKWHVPHFEKMLYDNAQLIDLYTEAFNCLAFQPFKQLVVDCFDWTFREMMSPDGLFYSALDADSEGVEGKFYVWDKQEFDAVLGEDATLVGEYFNVTEEGNWEEEKTNILRRVIGDSEIIEKYGIDSETLYDKIALAKAKLLDARSERVRPHLDDKCLTAWNAMMIKALANASQSFYYEYYYDRAVITADFILNNLKTEDGGLYRNYKDGKASIIGFLDDYAFLIEALIALYEADFDEKWLNEAKALTDYVLVNFNDDASPMLFYTSAKGESLIARKHEVMDNVIPASNSTMSLNLQKLGLFFDNEKYIDKAKNMLNAVLPTIKSYGSAYSNWAIQLYNEVYGISEIALVGEDIEGLKMELNQYYIPNKITMGGTKSSLPLLKDKQSNETKVYICKNKVCQLPVYSVPEALKYLQ